MTDALSIADAVRNGRTPAVEIIGHALDKAAQNDGLGAFLSIDADAALDRAAQIDAEQAGGTDPGPLAGVPIAVKDNIAQQGRHCGCASRILEGYVAPRTATALERMEAAGAVVIGRTNMDEFGMGSSGENSAHRPTHNPWDRSRVPGGSSSGSAAAVAADILPIALGSDTGGSVRQPAALCGVVGLKPTYGRVSRSGLVAFGSSLDQIGPIGRSVRDAALCLAVMAGSDPLDSSAADLPVGDLLAACDRGVDGLRIGLPTQCWGPGADDAVLAVNRAAIDQLVAQGATVHEVDIPSLAMAIPAYYLLTSAEASSNLARFDGIGYGPRANEEDLETTYIQTRSNGFGPEVQRRILLGTFALSAGYADAYYRRADAVRHQMRAEIGATLESMDVLAMPTTPSTAFPIGERVDDPVQMYLSDIFTTPPSLTGHPAISVPSGTTHGLPVGLQIVGRSWDEATLLAISAAVERSTGLLRPVAD